MTALLSRAVMSLPLGAIDAMLSAQLAKRAPAKVAQACVPDCSQVYNCGFIFCCIGDDCYQGAKYCDHCGNAYCYAVC